MVPIGARPPPIYDGALVEDALALREMAEHVVVAALLTEREDGTSWAEIGRTAGVDETTVRDRWAENERAWRADLEGATGHPPCDGATGTCYAADMAHAGMEHDAVDPEVAARAGCVDPPPSRSVRSGSGRGAGHGRFGADGPVPRAVAPGRASPQPHRLGAGRSV